MPLRSWSREWKKGTWIQRLSGLTCEPSTVARGVAKWISSLPGFHVSLSVLLESVTLKKIHGISGQPYQPLLPMLSHGSCSSKTSTSEHSSNHGETFEQWASRCRTPLRVRPPSWVRDILGGGSSFLPTLNTSQPDRGVRLPCPPGYELVFRLTDLRKAFLPTPRAGVHDQPGAGVRHPTLKNALLPALSAQSYGSNQGGGAGRVGPKRHGLTKLIASPRVSKWGQADSHGKVAKGLVGGQVNPTWKEWFMGFPSRWTSIP